MSHIQNCHFYPIIRSEYGNKCSFYYSDGRPIGYSNWVDGFPNCDASCDTCDTCAYMLPIANVVNWKTSRFV